MSDKALTKIIDLSNVRPDRMNEAIRNAVNQVSQRHNTQYLNYLALLRSNLLLVAQCNDDQADVEMPDGDTVQTHLGNFADYISDMMAAIERSNENDR